MTARVTVRRFCAALARKLGPINMRTTTDADTERIQKHSERFGTSSLLGTIDCCKWEWKNCLKAWYRVLKGKKMKTTVMLVAIADRSLLIWHAFFGMKGCLNDINVVEASIVLTKNVQGTFNP